MSAIWQNWEGQVIEHKYRLLSLLGSTDHSVVFLAEYRAPEPQRCAIKFVAGDIPNSEQIIEDWKSAAQLNHPNLLRILATGRCRIEDMDLLYVAMEQADENLAEIIPQRALTPDEAREALNAIVDVLVFLHGKGLTHGHICLANILATGEYLKVSSDTIEPVAEKREMTRERSAYDAPEIPGSPYTQSADIWSLGVTLVEMLTQQRALLPYNENVDPVIPQVVREPFLEIARHALRRKSANRWTAAQIAERLNPNAVAAKAAVAGAAASGTATSSVPAAETPIATMASSPQSVSMAQAAPVMVPPAPSRVSGSVEPLSVPLSKEPAVPLAKQAKPTVPPMHAAPPAPNRAERQTFVLPNYALPAFLIALILLGAIVLPKILRNRPVSQPATKAAPVSVANKPPNEPVKPLATPAVPKSETTNPVDNATSKTAAQEDAKSIVPPAAKEPDIPTPAPAVMRTKDSATAVKARSSSEPQGRGEVLDQELPQVPSKALSTITGTVRVVVKAHVDAAGQVAGVELQEPGPSRYFADKATQAAQHWVFNSPEVNGRSVESEWLIRFEYTRDGVKAIPQQVAP